MKTKKQRTQKDIIQQKLKRLAKLDEPAPPTGWIRALRGSLGLSIRQLAERVGVHHGSINQIEKREPFKKVTLESLEKVAQAMDCKVIYAVVPKNLNLSIDEIIEHNANRAAGQILEKVAHTMQLESQGTSKKLKQQAVRDLVRQMIDSNDPRIWKSDKKKR